MIKSTLKKLLNKLNLYSFALKIYRNLLYFKSYFFIRLLNRHKVNAKIMSREETVKYILANKCSVIRYGDGEFISIFGGDIGYQTSNTELSSMLKKYLIKDTNKLLVCIPESLINTSNLVSFAKKFWISYVGCRYKTLNKILNQDIYYGNAHVFRPYIDFNDKNNAHIYFNLIKQLWNDKNILIVEGSLSRSGVGNDLFDNAKSVSRIICPSKNAFSSYDIIKDHILSLCKDRDSLILVALGPTAKPLVCDLADQGYWAIDIGHIDTDYEWYLRGAQSKEIIAGKHTAEHSDIDIDDCNDKKYLGQIIDVIK